MLARAFSVLLIWLGVFASGSLAVAQGTAPPLDTTPPSTFNVFYPEQRPLGDCVGTLQRPNCGSEARGGWAQYTIAVLMVGGLTFIGWRVVRLARRTSASRKQVATTVPDGGGGDRGP